MSNGDVLWAWVAGVLVSLVLLILLSRLDEPTGSAAYDENFTLPEATLGTAQWNIGEWERTGGTPERRHLDDAPHDALDLMERIVPERTLFEVTPAVAEGSPGK